MPADPSDPFRRLVARAQSRPVNRVKEAPTSAYTQDVIARGSQAVADRAAGASYDSTQGSQALDWAKQTGYGAAPTDAYQSWLSQQGFSNQYPVTFGQSKKGAYSGFKTEGELKAAITGRADQARMADHNAAEQQFQGASNTLGGLMSQYGAGHDKTMAELVPAAEAGSALGLGRVVPTAGSALPGSGPTPLGISHDFGDGSTVTGGVSPQAGIPASGYVTAGPTAQDTRDALTGASRAHELSGYDQQLNEWLAAQSQSPIDEMQTARQIEATPLREYQGQAAGAYGVDPNLAAGWFPQSSDVTDFTNQQNLQSLQDYGVPMAQFNTWQNQQQQQQDADARQAVTDQTAATKAATVAASADTQAAVAQATGLDADQLAQAANMTPDQVAQVVATPDFTQANADLQRVLGVTDDPDYANMSDEDRQTDLDTVIAQVKRDPQMYAILKSIYGDYATF